MSVLRGAGGNKETNTSMILCITKHKSLLHVQNVTNESVQYDLAKSITSETIASMNDKGQDYKSTSLRVYLASNVSWYREAVSA